MSMTLSELRSAINGAERGSLSDLGRVLRAIANGDVQLTDGDFATLTLGGTQVTATAAEINQAADISSMFEIVTTTNAIAAAENGKTFFLNAATGFVSTLPAPALGLRFKFVVGATAPSSGNHTIVTTGSANIIKGGLAGAEVDDTTDFDTATADDTVSFVASNAVSGDWVELVSDGTNWYVRGWSAVRAGLTLTQASA